MATLVFGNGWISGETQALMAILAPPVRVSRGAIIRVHDMAGRTSARAIISRVIIAAEKIQQRIVQARFLQTEEYGVGPIECPKSAFR